MQLYVYLRGLQLNFHIYRTRLQVVVLMARRMRRMRYVCPVTLANKINDRIGMNRWPPPPSLSASLSALFIIITIYPCAFSTFAWRSLWGFLLMLLYFDSAQENTGKFTVSRSLFRRSLCAAHCGELLTCLFITVAPGHPPFLLSASSLPFLPPFPQSRCA